jgi:hypothetical protein
MTSKRWTDTDIKHLKALLADGSSAIRASVALKRTLKSVQLQARKLGTPFPPLARSKLPKSPSNLWPRRRAIKRERDEDY